MLQRILSTRSLFFTAILVIAIIASIAPVAADDSTAYLAVISNPVGAMACLDHYTCHTTPASFTTTPNSYHSLTISKEGYQMFTQTVYTAGTNGTTTVTVTLGANPLLTGTLDLDSNPTNADIWLDSLYYGTTPQIIGGLSEGTHTLVLRKAGYYDYTEPFNIVAGQISTKNPAMTPYSKSSGYGDIQVQSVPVGAAVYVNNNYQGTTISSAALYVTQLTPGSYPVRITLAGYQPYTVTAVVTAGGVYDIRANLVPVTPGPTPDANGQITVRSRPSGANIYLDNAYHGLTPLTLVEIPQGTHTILLRMNGYQDWQSSVNVAADSSTDVSGTLVANPATATTQPAPTTEVTQPAPLQTRSPISVVSILSAIGICGAAAIVYRKKE